MRQRGGGGAGAAGRALRATAAYGQERQRATAWRGAGEAVPAGEAREGGGQRHGARRRATG